MTRVECKDDLRERLRELHDRLVLELERIVAIRQRSEILDPLAEIETALRQLDALGVEVIRSGHQCPVLLMFRIAALEAYLKFLEMHLRAR